MAMAASKPRKKGVTATASKNTATKGSTEEPVSQTATDMAPVEAAAETAVEPVETGASKAVETQPVKATGVLEPEEEEDDDDDDDEEADDEEEDDDESEGATTDDGEAQGNDENDGILRIPENEWNFLQEILKNPIGNNEYEISKEAPKMAFKGRGSPKTLAQTAKNKLIERNIIELVQPGGAQRRAIVKLLVDSVEMSREGRGRKINPRKPRTTTASVPGRRPGRPKGSVNRTERTPQVTEEGSTSGRRPGRASYLQTILAELRDPNYEDPNEFAKELEKMNQRFPNTFNKFLKRVQQPRGTNTNTSAAA